jgi:hypothetical protein
MIRVQEYDNIVSNFINKLNNILDLSKLKYEIEQYENFEDKNSVENIIDILYSLYNKTLLNDQYTIYDGNMEDIFNRAYQIDSFIKKYEDSILLFLNLDNLFKIKSNHQFNYFDQSEEENIKKIGIMKKINDLRKAVIIMFIKNMDVVNIVYYNRVLETIPKIFDVLNKDDVTFFQTVNEKLFPKIIENIDKMESIDGLKKLLAYTSNNNKVVLNEISDSFSNLHKLLNKDKMNDIFKNLPVEIIEYYNDKITFKNTDEEQDYKKIIKSFEESKSLEEQIIFYFININYLYFKIKQRLDELNIKSFDEEKRQLEIIKKDVEDSFQENDKLFENLDLYFNVLKKYITQLMIRAIIDIVMDGYDTEYIEVNVNGYIKIIKETINNYETILKYSLKESEFKIERNEHIQNFVSDYMINIKGELDDDYNSLNQNTRNNLKYFTTQLIKQIVN